MNVGCLKKEKIARKSKRRLIYETIFQGWQGLNAGCPRRQMKNVMKKRQSNSLRKNAPGNTEVTRLEYQESGNREGMGGVAYIIGGKSISMKT